MKAEDFEYLKKEVTITKGELLKLIGLSRVAANKLYDENDKKRINSEIQIITDKYFTTIN
jgi:hypothetical protein